MSTNALNWAHPFVREWFLSRFGSPTEPQEQGWPHIIAGRTTLISAPTGSGKTLAAFLTCIDALVRKSLAGELQDETEVVYVSPLRALSNDIEKNLQIPLREILELAKRNGAEGIEIRTAVRTGDTLTRDRSRMLRRPPHILVTTPESLYILLTAQKSRAVLQNVHTVIIDEIHAVADDKRGAHLSLSLERLSALAKRPPVRIGLSATTRPLDIVARFLAGSESIPPVVVNIGHRRDLDLAVEVPSSELAAIASHELWDEIQEKISELVNQHRSTLIFVNTRKLAERTAHRLRKNLGDEAVAAHHGSLSRKIRLDVESKLKSGQLKALVATASLELGIDIGAIDLVCQIGSPRSIAVALQRIGRAGHWRGAVPKGRLFPTTRDDLVESAALVRAIKLGDLDQLSVPEMSLDILAQQIAAICAAEDWSEDRLFDLVRSAYPYRNLSRQNFDEVLQMLTDGYATSRGRHRPYLHRDAVQGVVKARRGTRLTAIMNGGAIPETGMYTVVAEPEEQVVGTLDEDFAIESNQGDIILLGTTSWLIRRVESAAARVRVQDAHGAPPTVPFWRGEAPGRTSELSQHVSQLRKKLDEMLPPEIPADDPFAGFSQQDTGANASPSAPNEILNSALCWLMQDCALDRSGAEQLITYLLEGRAVLGAVPTLDKVIAERFFDEGGGMQLIIHAPFGAAINRAWGLALRKRFCRSFNLELQAAATDDGINISLAEQHSFPLADVFKFVHPNTVEEVLTQAALASPIFNTRWRWDAVRALAVTRFRGGKKVPLQILRMGAEDLLASVFPEAAACQDNVVGEIKLPDHPLVKETMKDVLQEAMDLDGLKRVLNDLQSGAIRTVAVDTPVPSAFCHEILNSNPYAYLDDAPLEERRSRAVSMRRVLPSSVVSEIGMLDPAAIGEVREQCWHDVRTADDLHDALLTMVVLPSRLAPYLPYNDPSGVWQEYFAELSASGRAGAARWEGSELWFAAENLRAFQLAYPQAEIVKRPALIEQTGPHAEDAAYIIVRGWMPFCGPVTVDALSGTLKIARAILEHALIRLETTGAVLRGNFSTGRNPSLTGDNRSIEWCDRRLLARIHRTTLRTLRKQIEPVTAAQFLRWLFRWQHVAPETQLRGERGTLEILGQLQGFEIAAREWERQILPLRVKDYHPGMLDRLCWTGTIGWGRFSAASSVQTARQTVPGSAAPITFFLRDNSEWLFSNARRNASEDGSLLNGESSLVLESLKSHGASFVTDLAKFTGLRKSEVELALWQLVNAGYVTADGFDSLRSLLNSRQKLRAISRSGAGRWSLLHAGSGAAGSRDPEAICKMLLQRYGIVFRDMIQRETLVPTWRELVVTLRRMEDRGEIRGGRFVSGFAGEQFALPLAVDSLRSIRKSEPTGDVVSLSAADPLNLSGIIVPGERLPSSSLTRAVFRDGLPLV